MRRRRQPPWSPPATLTGRVGSHYDDGSQVLAACPEAVSGGEVGLNLSQPSAAAHERAAGRGPTQGDGHGANECRVVNGDFSICEPLVDERSRSNLFIADQQRQRSRNLLKIRCRLERLGLWTAATEAVPWSVECSSAVRLGAGKRPQAISEMALARSQMQAAQAAHWLLVKCWPKSVNRTHSQGDLHPLGRLSGQNLRWLEGWGTVLTQAGGHHLLAEGWQALPVDGLQLLSEQARVCSRALTDLAPAGWTGLGKTDYVSGFLVLRMASRLPRDDRDAPPGRAEVVVQDLAVKRSRPSSVACRLAVASKEQADAAARAFSHAHSGVAREACWHDKLNNDAGATQGQRRAVEFCSGRGCLAGYWHYCNQNLVGHAQSMVSAGSFGARVGGQVTSRFAARLKRVLAGPLLSVIMVSGLFLAMRGLPDKREWAVDRSQLSLLAQPRAHVDLEWRRLVQHGEGALTLPAPQFATMCPLSRRLDGGPRHSARFGRLLRVGSMQRGRFVTPWQARRVAGQSLSNGSAVMPRVACAVVWVLPKLALGMNIDALLAHAHRVQYNELVPAYPQAAVMVGGRKKEGAAALLPQFALVKDASLCHGAGAMELAHVGIPQHFVPFQFIAVLGVMFPTASGAPRPWRGTSASALYRSGPQACCNFGEELTVLTCSGKSTWLVPVRALASHTGANLSVMVSVFQVAVCRAVL